MASPKILFRAAIAAINNDSDVCVFTLDDTGTIRQSQALSTLGQLETFDPLVPTKAKIGSPIAVASKGFDEIHIFYISESNTLQEAVFYKDKKEWAKGASIKINDKEVDVAPYSKLAATFIHFPESKGRESYYEIRLCAQTKKDTIIVYNYSPSENKWTKGAEFDQAALSGSSITSTGFGKPSYSFRVYFQLPDRTIVEYIYEGGWKSRAVPMKPTLAPRAALAVTHLFLDGTDRVRLYYAAVDKENTLKEVECTEPFHKIPEWTAGDFAVPCIPGSEVAVINWGTSSDGLNLRVYLQDGAAVENVREQAWKSSKWLSGLPSVPFL